MDGSSYIFSQGRTTNGGLSVNVESVLKDGIKLSSFKRVGKERIPIFGKYKIELVDGEFTATHIPSEQDRYFKEPDVTDTDLH